MLPSNMFSSKHKKNAILLEPRKTDFYQVEFIFHDQLNHNYVCTYFSVNTKRFLLAAGS